MASFVQLAGAPPAANQYRPRGIWDKLPLFIPIIGVYFQYKKMVVIQHELINRPNLSDRISLIQEATKINGCSAVRDLVEATGLFLLAGYGVEVPLLFTPSDGYIWGSLCASCFLFFRPYQIYCANRAITLLRNNSPVELNQII